MRNLLLLLTLCFVAASTSNVFATGYDASQRTERLGMSFYEGRPLYIVFLYGYPSILNPTEYHFEAHRVLTGENIEDFGDYNPSSGGVVAPKEGEYVVWGYYARGDDGELTLLTTGRYDGYPIEGSDDWISQALRDYEPGVASGDIAVDVFDAMLEPLSQMLRGWLGVVLAIGAVMFGFNFIRQLWTLDFSGKSKNGKGSEQLSYSKLSRRDRIYYEDAALGSIGLESSQLLIPKKIKKDVDFVTGAAFGLKFDEKTRESNRLLMEMFNRLSSREQKAILQAFRETAFDKSFEDSAEKRFLAYQGEVFADETNPFSGRRKKIAPPAFDPLDADELARGYGSDYVGWADMEIDDANASLDEAYYDDNEGVPF